MKLWQKTPVLAATLMALGGCGDAPGNDGIVARVDDYALTVDQVVDLIVDEERLPAQAMVIEQLAALWIDYTLLAQAAATDSTFASLDVESMVRQQIDQLLIFQLRDSVIQADTAVTDAELQALYEAETPDVRLRAHHILLTYPLQATAAQKDTVRAQIERVRAAIAGGASFEEMARQFSHDRGSATSGGDLGYFGGGDMVEPFQEAAFALQPGEVSGVVETPLGLHLIRLDERQVQDFTDVAPGFRARVQTERFLAAESTYIAGIEERAAPGLGEGAYAVAREIAASPGARLSGRAARRAIFEYQGGSVTVRELQDVLRGQPAALRQQIVESPDDELDRFLRSLVQRELLVEEARRAGLAPPAARIDSLQAAARTELRRAARQIGLLSLDQAPGEAVERAVSRAVLETLSRIVTGSVDMVPLGQVSYELRDGHAFGVFDLGAGQAILRVGRLRAGRSPSQLENSVDTVAVPGTSPGNN